MKQDLPPAPAREKTDFNVINFEVGKLELKPGDKIVMRTEMILTKDQVEHIRAMLAPFVPGHEIIVLTSGLTLEILRPVEK